MIEEWKQIDDYPYAVSNLGRVKSLKRKYSPREFILKPGHCGKHRNYCTVRLTKNKIPRSFYIHDLVWDAFGDGRKKLNRNMCIDHIDNNWDNNSISNLQLISNRDNIIKGYLNKKTSSKYTGIWWCKSAKKWMAKIYYNGEHIILGKFDNEIDAYNTYMKKYNEFNIHV